MVETKLPWWRKISDNVVRVGLIVLAILLIANLIRSVEANYSISRQIRSLHDQIAQVQDDETVITQENAYFKTDTYKEIQARLRLGYVKQGEKMVLVPTNKDETSATNASGGSNSALTEARKSWDEQPPYQQWYSLFFGSQTLLEETFGS